MAIRAALGESRVRLAGSVLLESLALGVAGGLAGLLLALGAVRLLVRFGPQELPRLEEVSVDAGVLLFGLRCRSRPACSSVCCPRGAQAPWPRPDT